MKDGEEISCKITEIGEDFIKYKKLDFLDGPNFNSSYDKIFMITFENGEKMVFNDNSSDNTGEANVSVLESGTRIILINKANLSGELMTVGMSFELYVRDDFVDANGYILFKQNTMVTATVTKAEKKKALGKAGEFGFAVESVKATDGQQIGVSYNFNTAGESKSAAAIGVGAVLFAPALLMKGKEAEIIAGTQFPVIIRSTTKIKIN